jgi:hypothetical protein
MILSWLDHYRSDIESTVFVCGVLFERFGPGGLETHHLGLNTNLCNEGDYIINVRTMRASAPIYGVNHQANVNISMIAAQDAARLIVRAIGFSRWPREMTMVGDRMTVREVCNTVVRARGSFLPC